MTNSLDNERRTLNVAMLRRIQQHVIEEPNRLDMSDWFHSCLTPGAPWHDQYNLDCKTQIVPKCGTVGCINGWCDYFRRLDGEENHTGMLYTTSYEFLGLRSSNLFFVNRWPWNLKTAYEKATTPQEKALVCSQAIDLVVENDGDFTPERE